MPRTRAQTRLTGDEEYWRDVEENGFDLNLSHPQLDAQIELLDSNFVTPDQWRTFFSDYFNWIVSDINAALRVARMPDYVTLENTNFIDGGFDNSFYPNEALDIREQQRLINQATFLYDEFFSQMQDSINQNLKVSGIVRDSLSHIFTNLMEYVDTDDQDTSLAHYSESMVILELIVNKRLFYLYMTDDASGRTRRVVNTHPTYYIGIWLRKGPIWGVGNNDEYGFDQLRSFVCNFSRRIINFMFYNGTTYHLGNIGNVHNTYRGHLRGGSSNQVKNKSAYKKLFIKQSVNNAIGRINSLLLDIVMNIQLKSKQYINFYKKSKSKSKSEGEDKNKK